MEIKQYLGYANREDVVKVEFGKTCKAIGQNAFNGCTNLTSEIIIREGITLGYYAFNGSGITKLTIGNGITINDRDFESCTKLESVVIGDNVTIKAGTDMYNSPTLGTFSKCTSLKKVAMGENTKMSNTHWANNWFSGCTALEEVTVKSLSEVGQNAFINVKSALKGNIIINEGVTKIGVNAFYGCTNITNVKIPNTVTQIGIDSFNSCVNLSSIIIPDSVTNIDQRAFYGCTNLESEIIIREGTTLGHYAFNGSGITKLTIENGITINDRDFESCTKLESVVIGDNVTIKAGTDMYNSPTLGTFSKCTSLKKVVMGENIKMSNNHWANNWFVGCTALEEVTVKSLSEVGINAFRNVKSTLKGNIIINEGVTKIGNAAFSGCTNIKSVKIPNTITEIGLEVFKGCTGLTKIQVDMTEEEFNNVTKGSNWNSGVTATIEYLR